MESIIALVAFCVLVVTFVVRTVFYAINIIVNAKVAKRSLKLTNKMFKSCEPFMNYFGEIVDKMKSDE